MNFSIPILLYHHISPDREITPEALESQLRYLLDQGYESVSLEDVYGVCRGAPRAKPAFAVTFDDGYLDNWLCAFPVLQKLRVKATMYLVTDYVETFPSPRTYLGTLDTRKSERGPGGFLSWSEAKAMAASGLVTIGSHTKTHRHFMRRELYADLSKELRDSCAAIESNVGARCTHLAWPWGDFEDEWLPEAESAGYLTASTTLVGANSLGTHPLTLRRLNVSRPSKEWLASRLRWNRYAWSANAVGSLYGWDRRLKTWMEKGSPYSHG